MKEFNNLYITNKMPKKNKSKTNNNNIKRNLILPDIDYQIFGYIEKALGSRFFEVRCLDLVTRRCKVRNKRIKIKQDDFCIISLREFDDKNADIIHRYNLDEIRELRKLGLLPSNKSLGIRNISHDEQQEDCSFNFEDI